MIDRIPIAGCGFLFAVLLFDLTFDVLILEVPPGASPDAALDSIARYYARVTTETSPASGLVGGVMLVSIVTAGVSVFRKAKSRALMIAAFGLIVAPVMLAGLRIVPNAIRLGSRVDPVEVQFELARSIAFDHIACLAAITLALGLQLFAATRSG